MTTKLEEAPTLLRGPIARGLAAKSGDESPIVRTGGDYGAGLIRGAAVLTRGVAEGHGMWVDATMLEQTRDFINAATLGTKSRFAHPSMSGDGLGKALGRYRKAELGSDIVRADLNMFESAHKTPDGDLAGYLMDLAAEDPSAFGNSIAFLPDLGAEQEFAGKHSDKDGKFKSPDKDNTDNLFHARIATLEAIDAVDEPAANPDGLFHRGHEIALETEDILAYVFGQTEDEPDTLRFGIAPSRIRAAVRKYLNRHNLCLLEDKAQPPTRWRVLIRRRRLDMESEPR